jgi:hypothetical protein
MSSSNTVKLGAPLDTGPSRPYVNSTHFVNDRSLPVRDGQDHGYHCLISILALLSIRSYPPVKLVQHRQNHLISEIVSAGRAYTGQVRQKQLELRQAGGISMS